MDICEKFIIQLTKVLIGVLELHPFCYVELIPTSLEFAVFYCFTESGQALTFERFIIQCLNLIRSMLQSIYYRPAKIVEGMYVLSSIFPHLYDIIMIGMFYRNRDKRSISIKGLSFKTRIFHI